MTDQRETVVAAIANFYGDCGKSSPRATTGYTQSKWMTKHEAECPGRDPRPVLGTYWTNDGWVTEYEQVGE